jgi:capsular polysaccharide biosynthesis protein
LKEIDLLKILKVILEHLVPILISGILLAVMTFGYCTFFAAPTYRTTTTILVNNGGFENSGPSSGSISGSDISASLYLITTCVDVLQSDNIYKDLASALDDKYSYYSLKSSFAACSRGENSMLIDIYTFGHDPIEIKKLANTFLEIAPTFITNNIFNADVKILATADNAVKTGPKIAFNSFFAFVIGVFTCAAVFVIIHFCKNTIESEKDFKARYEVPLLGCVPFFENKQTGGKRNGRKAN